MQCIRPARDTRFFFVEGRAAGCFFLLIERDPIRWIDDRIRNAPLPPMGGAGKVNDLIDRRRITAFTM